MEVGFTSTAVLPDVLLIALPMFTNLRLLFLLLFSTEQYSRLVNSIAKQGNSQDIQFANAEMIESSCEQLCLFKTDRNLLEPDDNSDVKWINHENTVHKSFFHRLITSMLTLTLFLLIEKIVIQALPLTCNNLTQFDCRTFADPQGCIPLEWLCDGLKDCKNGLDESHCSYLHSCPEGNFICRSGECVSGRYKCNGEVDCPGGEDENGCENHETFIPAVSVPLSDCPEHMFHCLHGPCIARAYICDGEADCPLNEDERNCTNSDHSVSIKHELTSCDTGMVLCADRTVCFPKHWVCDGEADCLDGSDESDCDMSVGNFLIESLTELCHPGEHRCSEAHMCIPLNRTCDGVRDCPRGDDEGTLCNECQSRKTPCEYKCTNTPLGSRCICPHGSTLNADEFSCTQIDECLTIEAKQCEQYCEDLHNSYQCTCAPGYQLGEDRHSCRLDRDHEGKLFVALGHEIRTMPLFESRSSQEGYETVQSLGSHGVVRSIDFVANRQLIYMTISGSDLQGEVAVSVGGLLRVVRENIVGVGQVAVDWMNGNFFFTQRYPSQTPGIRICSQDGFFCRRIIKGQTANIHDHKKRQYYRGIALHPQRGSMVWIESFNGRHKIMLASMDGANVRILVENKLEYPTGISIDFIRNDVYFGDIEREMIERVNIDTQERTVILTKGVHHPYDLKYFNGFLYWTDWASSSLKVAELSVHHEFPHLIHSFITLPYGLAINHSMYQPTPSSNPCVLNDCQWICVSILDVVGKLQPKCLCPDGYHPWTNDDCIPFNDSVIAEVHRPPVEEGIISDLSHIGVAWMKERCDDGDGCLNGGQCEDVKNEHGRVTQIVCNCVSPYEGYRCERLNPYKELAEQLPASSQPHWLTLFVIMTILLFFVAIFIFSYRYINQISNASKAVAMSLEQKVRLVLPHLQRVQQVIESIKTRLSSKLTNTSIRSCPRVFRTEINNPLFSDEPPHSPEQSQNELSYSNPLFVENNSHGAPFSGINVTYSNKFVP